MGNKVGKTGILEKKVFPHLAHKEQLHYLTSNIEESSYIT